MNVKHPDVFLFAVNRQNFVAGAIRQVAVPAHLKNEINDILRDDHTRNDMVLQLLKLEEYDGREQDVRLVQGKLLYINRDLSNVTWGVETYQATESFEIISCEVIGETVYWIQRMKFGFTPDYLLMSSEGFQSKAYMKIDTLIDVGGKPCFSAMFPHPSVINGYSRSVVWGEEEGQLYDEIEHLMDVHGRPAYVARPLDHEHKRILVWGNQEIAYGSYISEPVMYRNGMVCVVRYAPHEEVLVHVTPEGVEILDEGAYFLPPFVINGKLLTVRTHSKNRSFVNHGTDFIIRYEDDEFNVYKVGQIVASDERDYFAMTSQTEAGGPWSLSVNFQTLETGERCIDPRGSASIMFTKRDRGSHLVHRAHLDEQRHIFDLSSYNIRS